MNKNPYYQLTITPKSLWKLSLAYKKIYQHYFFSFIISRLVSLYLAFDHILCMLFCAIWIWNIILLFRFVYLDKPFATTWSIKALSMAFIEKADEKRFHLNNQFTWPQLIPPYTFSLEEEPVGGEVLIWSIKSTLDGFYRILDKYLRTHLPFY